MEHKLTMIYDLRDSVPVTMLNRLRCRAKIYPAVKNYPPPVTLPSVLSAVRVYRAELILGR